MKVSKQIREKRIKEIHHLYELALQDSDATKEELYQLIKKTLNDNKDKIDEAIINFLYNEFGNVLSLTLSEIKKIYHNINDNELIIKDLLYNQDDKTLEERVSNWCKEDKNNILNLFYHICCILDTETYQIIVSTIKTKVNTDYVEIINGDCDHCGVYCDGEAHPIEEIDLPPYHTNCRCEAVFYEKEDIY